MSLIYILEDDESVRELEMYAVSGKAFILRSKEESPICLLLMLCFLLRTGLQLQKDFGRIQITGICP